jgi:hypothetical protein
MVEWGIMFKFEHTFEIILCENWLVQTDCNTTFCLVYNRQPGTCLAQHLVCHESKRKISSAVKSLYTTSQS